MATHTLAGTVGAESHSNQHRLFQLESDTIDLGDNSVATGDVVECLYIPAGTKVTSVTVKIVEAMGLTATATVGDASGANSWDASTNLNATAGTYTTSVGGTDAYATAGKLYATADTIDLTCTIAAGPATAGQVKVYAACEKFA